MEETGQTVQVSRLLCVLKLQAVNPSNVASDVMNVPSKQNVYGTPNEESFLLSTSRTRF
jgi:hypothetical protein